MVTGESNPIIEGNKFIGNTYGICIKDSSPIIRYNEFQNNTEFAIRYYENSNPTIENNTFEGNGEDVDSALSFDAISSSVCYIMFVIGVVINVYLLIKVKQRIAQDKVKEIQ